MQNRISPKQISWIIQIKSQELLVPILFVYDLNFDEIGK